MVLELGEQQGVQHLLQALYAMFFEELGVHLKGGLHELRVADVALAPLLPRRGGFPRGGGGGGRVRLSQCLVVCNNFLSNPRKR